MSAAKLTFPNKIFKNSYLEALGEFHREGRFEHLDVLKLADDFDSFIKQQCDPEVQHGPLPEWSEYVPETVLWLVKEDEYIGTVSIRHRLNWHLEKYGGHIGYIIRPSWRGKGYGNKILRWALPVAQHLGIDKLLVTCGPENIISRRVIEENGGVFHDEMPATDQHPTRLRFWIDLEK